MGRIRDYIDPLRFYENSEPCRELLTDRFGRTYTVDELILYLSESISTGLRTFYTFGELVSLIPVAFRRELAQREAGPEPTKGSTTDRLRKEFKNLEKAFWGQKESYSFEREVQTSEWLSQILSRAYFTETLGKLYFCLGQGGNVDAKVECGWSYSVYENVQFTPETCLLIRDSQSRRMARDYAEVTLMTPEFWLTFVNTSKGTGIKGADGYIGVTLISDSVVISDDLEKYIEVPKSYVRT